jgi:molecular chaperone HscB
MAQNAFTLLSLPAVFALSEEKVEEAWRRAIALVHPDKFASRPAAERRVAEQWAGRINEARDALIDPVSRATLLLQNAGVDVGRETDTRMPGDFLMQQMLWREALEDADKIRRLTTEVQACRDELIAQLTRSIDVEHDFDGARSQVRRLMFVEKLLKEIHRAGSTAAAL